MTAKARLSAKQLKPCPWCGVAPGIKIYSDSGDRMWWIECRNKDCAIQPETLKGQLTEREAIADWDNRTPARRAMSRAGER